MNELWPLFQALYHSLPMNYVSISKLQNKLEGEANQATVRKLLDKMIQDGFVEVSGNRRLGKCIISITFSNQRKDISNDTSFMP